MSYRVLLIDDDTFFLKVYGDFLRTRGFVVDTAAGGVPGLTQYDQERYQLVVVDLVMPDLPGIEVIERIRERNPAQDVIVVTGTEDVRTAVRAMRLGVYDYLVKPLEREELMLVIDRLQERATLYDEHARLLNENIYRAEIQQVFQRGLRILSSLDLETVCENLLGTLSEICSAQGAALWLARDDGAEVVMHGYRGLIDPTTLPMAWSPKDGVLAAELTRGMPVLVRRDVTALQRQLEPSEGLLVPLAREGRLAGAVLLVDKLGGGFTARDASAAKLIGDCAGTAVSHARRFRHLERVGLRDPSTAAYNMTYFVDYLGRELHKARRYRRSFALVQISIDNLTALKQGLNPEVYRETLRRLTLAFSSVLRDIDVLARVTDEEMYLLLPETDFLGGLAFARSARDAIQKSPFLADIDRKHAINLSFGPAAFPRDGDDVDQLFAACRRRLDEARRSLFRRLHLEDADFWAAIDLLVGDGDAYRGDRVELSRALAVTEDEKGILRHAVFPSGFPALACQQVLSEAARQARASGWLFLGGSLRKSEEAALARMPSDGGAFKTYVLSPQPPATLGELAHVTPVRVDGDAFAQHELVLLLAEHAAYGLLARRRADGRVYGFHTADWTLIEGLIGKLQDAYHLQKGGA